MKKVKIKSIEYIGKKNVINLNVRKNHTFISSNGIITHNCDSLTSGPQGSQKLLRQLMEDTYKICRFILICNYENYIIPEIKSRCQVIKLDSPPKKEIGQLCLSILKNEGVDYNTKNVLEIIKKCYPDIRKTINVLQENVVDGKLTGSRVFASEVLFDKILNFIIKGDIEKLREELKSNYISYSELYQYLYENAGKTKQPGNVSKISVNHVCYRQIRSKSTNHSPLA